MSASLPLPSPQSQSQPVPASEIKREGKRKRESKNKSMTGDDLLDEYSILRKVADQCRNAKQIRERLEAENSDLSQKLSQRGVENLRLHEEKKLQDQKIADYEAELTRLREENEFLNNKISKMEPVTKAAFEMKAMADKVTTTFNKSIETHGVCELCNSEEMSLLLEGISFKRLGCPKCQRVHECCSSCIPMWKNDPKHPAMCMNRGYCDYKFDLPV